MDELQKARVLRLPDILGDPTTNPPTPALIPISKSAWWSGIKAGKFPKPLKLGPRMSVWRAADIMKVIEEVCSDSMEGPPEDAEAK